MELTIVGAGLSGRLLAWQLLEAGHTITLIDQDQGGGEHSAGMVAAAMLAPFSEILDAEPCVYEKGLAGIAVWQAWAKALLESTGVDIDVRSEGSLVVAHRNDMGDYQHFLQRLRHHSVVDQSAIQEINKNQLKTLEPDLAERFDKACYLPQEACLDNHALFDALARRIRALGATWITEKTVYPVDVNAYPDSDWVIDCRGFGAAGEVAGLRGVRGEVIRVFAPEVNLSRPVRLMHPRYKLYISPKPNHLYVIGATQIESADLSPITVRSSLELLSALYTVHTGFAEASIVSQAARCRPAFQDNLPHIRKNGKLLCVNGLHRHGYLLSPAVVGEVLSILNCSAILRWPALLESPEAQQ